MIEVLEAGPYSLIQDLGRPGHYATGLPPSGALDQYSARCANLLVGNHASAAVLEATLAGPTLRFSRSTAVAYTGGIAELWIDGAPWPCWTTAFVKAGQTLCVGTLTKGARGYLAVRGGFDTPSFLGSRSTYVNARIGGLDGSPLKAGDDVSQGSATVDEAPPAGASIDSRLWPTFEDRQRLRVVLGLCRYRFRHESLVNFFATHYTVTPMSDRTGYRLSGPELEFEDRPVPFGAGDNPSNVVDLGYPVGSLQAPNGQEIICLMRDAVTGGGYATIGTVVSADLDRIAQMQAPNEVMFEPVTVQEAVAARQVVRDRLRQAQVNINLVKMF